MEHIQESIDAILQEVAFLARHLDLDPDEVMTWRSSKRNLWSEVIGSQVGREKQIERVEQAYANSVAIMNPDELNRLLPDSEDPGQRLPMTEEKKKEALQRAEEIRSQSWSGSKEAQK